MRQIIQNVKTGDIRIATVPSPIAQPAKILIANRCSLISAGTEKMIMDLSKKSLLGKAKARPDHVKQIGRAHV